MAPARETKKGVVRARKKVVARAMTRAVVAPAVEARVVERALTRAVARVVARALSSALQETPAAKELAVVPSVVANAVERRAHNMD